MAAASVCRFLAVIPVTGSCNAGLASGIAVAVGPGRLTGRSGLVYVAAVPPRLAACRETGTPISVAATEARGGAATSLLTKRVLTPVTIISVKGAVLVRTATVGMAAADYAAATAIFSTALSAGRPEKVAAGREGGLAAVIAAIAASGRTTLKRSRGAVSLFRVWGRLSNGSCKKATSIAGQGRAGAARGA